MEPFSAAWLSAEGVITGRKNATLQKLKCRNYKIAINSGGQNAKYWKHERVFRTNGMNLSRIVGSLPNGRALWTSKIIESLPSTTLSEFSQPISRTLLELKRYVLFELDK